MSHQRRTDSQNSRFARLADDYNRLVQERQNIQSKLDKYDAQDYAMEKLDEAEFFEAHVQHCRACDIAIVAKQGEIGLKLRDTERALKDCTQRAIVKRSEVGWIVT